ncbi:hypothetical protein JCM19294_1117 [Nonlabens tegetincola]|uniref:Uncharacterized protein n=1 Tax=Nonlabens tegetincola TaxID=323273 RepID=A0A090Q4Y5_9FLAO|nr:hypothetical protein [Nonlabens tegetincola]GAK96808.1 hypothetical protein JCM19294_1117 [Nonlabens tegetincola]
MNNVPALDNSAVALLKSRNNLEKIQNLYIQRNLEAMAEEWADAQSKLLTGSQFADLLNKSKFKVTGTTLSHSHSETQRFIDMKKWYGRKRKPIKVHNTQLYITMNRLLFRLRYGFTRAVREQIAQTIEM